MKKLYLLLLLLTATMLAAAAQYDELDLLGTWEVIEKEGSTPLMRNIEWEIRAVENETGYYPGGPFKYMYLGEFSEETHPTWIHNYPQDHYEKVYGGIFTSGNPDEARDGHSYWPIADFFISNGDKLHIITCDNDNNETFRFVIEDFSDSTLKVRTFDNKLHLTFKRISVPIITEVSALPSEKCLSEGIYSLNGAKVQSMEKGIYIVKAGETTTKVMVP